MVQITFILCPLFSVKMQSTKARFLNLAEIGLKVKNGNNL